ncbi:molybdate ABC transporter permease subunit [Hymenobacter sp. GOD-10R]|uniref:molybdate ABC transporter permease subunit n=1 Tax=Hymenobacter sp. GOD-10R TaxID=3093922 RepID=UPI002D768BF1|nr:molybdate ABC transporter permease subunit [Hymenobacter sp. GOD-10R]WRQ27239.1 molybdate ABC transporter permease subunit [Hymenobacter sp. GOD-10R]
MQDYWQTLALTLRLAALTTFLLLGIGTALAYWLAYTRSRIKPLAEVLVGLPLVLPPTVLGFYLLLAFSPDTGLGRFLQHTLGLQLNFTFTGILVGSLFYSLPFMVQPLQAGFERLPPSLAEAAATLGKSRLTTLWRVLLPNCKPALLSGIVLTFAHTIGEFGVVLMIGGNIAGQTRVASIAIYDAVESQHYAQANAYSLVLVGLALLLLLLLSWLTKRRPNYPA